MERGAPVATKPAFATAAVTESSEILSPCHSQNLVGRCRIDFPVA